LFGSGTALVVEDNIDTQKWLTECLASAYPDLLIHTASNFEQGARCISDNKYVFALIDLGLPDGSGLDLIHTLCQQKKPCHVVVATIYDDDQNLLSALKFGAKGYILKDQDQDRIVSYLYGLKQNRPALSDSVSRKLISHFNDVGRSANSSYLTPREADTIRLLGEGKSVSEASELLGISNETVRTHVKSIYTKLGVNSRSELTLAAVRMGFVE